MGRPSPVIAPPPHSPAIKEFGDDIPAEVESTLQCARSMLLECMRVNMKNPKFEIEANSRLVEILRELDVDIMNAMFGKHPPTENSLTVSLMLLSAFHRFIEKVASYIRSVSGENPKGMEPLYEWHKVHVRDAEEAAAKNPDKNKKVKQNTDKAGGRGNDAENGLFGDGSINSELHNMGFSIGTTVYNRHESTFKCINAEKNEVHCPTGDFVLKAIQDGGQGQGRVAVVHGKGQTFHVKYDVFKDMFGNGSWQKSGFDVPLPNPERTIIKDTDVQVHGRVGLVRDAVWQVSKYIRSTCDPKVVANSIIVAPKPRVYAHANLLPGGIVFVPETNSAIVYKSKEEWDKEVTNSGWPDPARRVVANIRGDSGVFLIMPPKTLDFAPCAPFFNMQPTSMSSNANMELRNLVVNVNRDVAWGEDQNPRIKSAPAPANGATGSPEAAAVHAKAGSGDTVTIPVFVNTKKVDTGDELLYYKEVYSPVKDKRQREKETMDRIQAKKLKTAVAKTQGGGPK